VTEHGSKGVLGAARWYLGQCMSGTAATSHALTAGPSG
jgi:hypothetical protein